MIKNRIESVLNDQIAKEAYSSHLYLSMASWCETNGFAGTAAWLYVHANEERQHMLKFIAYVNERGGKSFIPSISEPPQVFSGINEMFEEILKHEQFISESINEIVGICIEEKDFTTNSWIQFFVNEQIEEESLVNGILDKLKLLDGKNMYIFDRDLNNSIVAVQ